MFNYNGFLYNGFLVLYFCGLEKNTYLEITKRSKLLSISSFYIEGDNFSDDNDDDNDNDNVNLTELGNNAN